MATGTNTYNGQGVPLKGESQIVQNTAATDILTITGASSQSGDFLVCETSAGSEVFVVDVSGNLTVAGTLAVTGDSTFTGQVTLTAVTAKASTGVDIGQMFMYRTGTAYRLGVFVTGTTAKYAKFSLTIGG